MFRFIVHENGNLSDFTALTHHGYGMEEEVLRVLKRSPVWTPAEQNGHKVASYYTQPITFVVSGENVKQEKGPDVITKANP